MKKKLTHNLGLKFASLFLAFVIWFLVAQIDDPQETTKFNNIQVRLLNTTLLDNENKVYEIVDNTDVVKSVTVKAPKSIIEQLRASDIVAEADMNNLTEINTIPINFYVLNADIDGNSITGSNEVVRLNVEQRETKWIELAYSVIGEAADGYVVSDVTQDQTRVEITGPKSLVDKVEYAKGEIEVFGATTDLSANVAAKLYDVDDNLIEQNSITQNVNYVHMSVEVLALKEVPIELNVMGVPAEGYMATGVVECQPSSVMIAGQKTVLDSINVIHVSEEELNITGQSQNMSATVNIKEYLPDNVRLAPNNFNGKVAALVYIEPLEDDSIQIPAGNIRISRIPEGFTATVSDGKEQYELKLRGLREQISALRPTSIIGSVDLKEWMTTEKIRTLQSGTYSVPVKFSLNEQLTIVEKLTVQITVSEQIQL